MLQSETVEPRDRRIHCSRKVQRPVLRQRQISKKGSVALVQLASRISAIMKIGAGADGGHVRAQDVSKVACKICAVSRRSEKT